MMSRWQLIHLSTNMEHKVEFFYGTKNAILRLSDTELGQLRKNSTWNNRNVENSTYGTIDNVAIHSLLELNKEYSRFTKVFPFHEYEKIYWEII